MSVTIEIPPEVTRALPVTGEALEREARLALALDAYAQGWLNLTLGAELAGLSRIEFGFLLGKRGIPRHYTEADLQQDLAYARSQ